MLQTKSVRSFMQTANLKVVEDSADQLEFFYENTSVTLCIVCEADR